MANTKPISSQITHKLDVSGASIRSLYSKLEDAISVKDFGAVGDGVTDDTESLINAFTYGGFVYVPEGEYLISAVGDGVYVTLVKPLTVTCHPNAKFFSDGLDGDMFFFQADADAVEEGAVLSFSWSGGIFDQTSQKVSTTVPFFTEYPPIPSMAGISDRCDALVINGSNGLINHVSVTSATFKSGDHWTLAGGDSGVYINGVQNAVVYNCNFKASRDLGIYISGSTDGATLGRLDIFNNYFDNCCHGAAIKRSGSGFSIRDNTFYKCARSVIVETAGVGNGSVAGTIENNYSISSNGMVRLFNCQNVNVVNNFSFAAGAFEADGVTPINESTIDGIRLTSCLNCAVINNSGIGVSASHVSSNSYFIRLDSSDGVKTTFSEFVDNSADGWYGVAIENVHGSNNAYIRNHNKNGTFSGVYIPDATSKVIGISGSGADIFETPVMFGSGSVDVPIVSSALQPSTGIYFPSGNKIGVSVNSSDKMIFESYGVNLPANNTSGIAGNVIRFTDTDGSAVSGQPFGKLEWYSSDSNGQGIKSYIEARAAGSNPGGGIFFGTSANTAGESASDEVTISKGGLYPASNNATVLGTSTFRWSYVHTYYLRTHAFTVSTLQSAATAGAGARAFVSDATATTFASVVVGGGANGVPVYSDGSNWRIG